MSRVPGRTQQTQLEPEMAKELRREDVGSYASYVRMPPDLAELRIVFPSSPRNHYDGALRNIMLEVYFRNINILGFKTKAVHKCVLDPYLKEFGRLVTISISGAVTVTVEELAAQNEYLTTVVKRLEKRLGDLEQTVSECKLPMRRQTYEGPVAFTYKLTSKYTAVHGNSAIVFPDRITDLGTGYNNATGVYTAPRHGIYMISCSLLADHGSHSNPMLHASIMVDGRPKANVFAFSESGTHRDQGANTIFVNLKQGSRVWVQAIDSSQAIVGGEKYSTFSGYLLWQF
ncbi:uncharacterized protein LOC123562254 [Mercenaria mercenaria]|uniref:uncharacterized protein LOC123562254 n=1 Tax=Mercenaria mercenaria TaxID=6596 RepID=UPI00234EA828|nr:uncharacterized protein LOC123562254 [Mercenaria mercenaria]